MAGNRNTFIVVPNDVTDAVQLHRFLSRLVEQLDVAFGVRSTTPFATASTVTSATSELASILGTEIEQVNSDLTLSLSSLGARTTTVEADILELESNLGNPAIADSSLPSLTFSATYVKTEADALAAQVQTLQSTVNTMLNRLRDAKIIGA